MFAPLHAFFELLVKWNARINLTALPLEGLPDRTVDRLFIEPLAAAPLLLNLPTSAWFDIGSGCGSPAFPLILARPELRLTLVESRARKASFLREAVRLLGISAEVEAMRFAELSERHPGAAGLITLRGVRLDAALGADINRVTHAQATIAVWGPRDATPVPQLVHRSAHRLIGEAFLHLYDVSRGTNR
jgi:16S rRNA (guanine527-N7)-methyltransferase